MEALESLVTSGALVAYMPTDAFLLEPELASVMALVSWQPSPPSIGMFRPAGEHVAPHEAATVAGGAAEEDDLRTHALREAHLRCERRCGAREARGGTDDRPALGRGERLREEEREAAAVSLLIVDDVCLGGIEHLGSDVGVDLALLDIARDDPEVGVRSCVQGGGVDVDRGVAAHLDHDGQARVGVRRTDQREVIAATPQGSRPARPTS